MKYTIRILRRDRGSTESYIQDFEYETENDSDTAATALTSLNSREALTDISGLPARAIEWECSCLQKKCGACAMRINGRPGLACDAVLADFGKNIIELEPLRKFPVICDLTVDRSILFENLKTLRLWLAQTSDPSDKMQELAYESSECLQCGCCLEICPNFYAGGKFFGMSAVPVTTRLLAQMSKAEYKEISRLYSKHIFSGCGKSLACRDICPKKIDTEKLLVNANALAVWKRNGNAHFVRSVNNE